MHVCKGGQISEVGAKFPRKFGPKGPNFRGARFPVTPAIIVVFILWKLAGKTNPTAKN